MKNYKAVMSRVDALLSKQDRKTPMSTSGLLSPQKKASVKGPEDTVDMKIAQYIALIRKQRQEMLK